MATYDVKNLVIEKDGDTYNINPEGTFDAEAFAIVSNGDNHPEIATYAYVYITNHPTLANGMYRSTTYISQNSQLSSVNVVPIDVGVGGALNNLYSETVLKANKSNTVLDTTLSRGRRANSTVGTGSFAFGNNVIASGDYSHAEGFWSTASGTYSHAEGASTTASGLKSHAEGASSTASGTNSHAEGTNTKATEEASHAEGYNTTASGKYSHAEAFGTTASGKYSHAEGDRSLASGDYSHAEGSLTTATGGSSHAEGYHTNATQFGSHAEGSSTTASGSQSHAEGYYTNATGACSHAEGSSTTASGSNSHAEGASTTASGLESHAEGYYTTAEGRCTHTQGLCNYSNPSISILVPNIEDAEPYDITKDFYYEGAMVAYNDQVWIAHNNTVVKRASPKYDRRNWYFYTPEAGEDTSSIEEWSSDVVYQKDDIVKVTDKGNVSYYKASQTHLYPYVYPGVAPDGNYDWHTQPSGTSYTKNESKFADIIGYGAMYTEGRNISATDWEGNQYLAGNIYVNCDSHSENGSKLVTADEVNLLVGAISDSQIDSLFIENEG